MPMEWHCTLFSCWTTTRKMLILNFFILVTDPSLFTSYCSKTYDDEWSKRIASMVCTKPISNWPPASHLGSAEGAQKIWQGSLTSQLLDHKILEHPSCWRDWRKDMNHLTNHHKHQILFQIMQWRSLCTHMLVIS
jgi:hypothetical protein